MPVNAVIFVSANSYALKGYSPVYFVGVTVYRGLVDEKLRYPTKPFIRYLNFSSTNSRYTVTPTK